MNNKQEKQLNLWALIRCKDQVNINISIIMGGGYLKENLIAKEQLSKNFLLTNQTVKTRKPINLLFPQVPKLRFKNFFQPWEQYKVKNIFTIKTGKVLSANLIACRQSSKNPYPVYSSKTINDEIRGYYQNYLFANAITWVIAGNAGKAKFRSNKFYLTISSGVLLSSNGFANMCNGIALNQIARKYVSDLDIYMLSPNLIAEIAITIPSDLAEQTKISKFFKILENTITLHQHKCQKLQKIKESLVKKMFV